MLTSKGGFPTSNVYNIHPTDHTSVSIPCGPRVATSLKVIHFKIQFFYACLVF